LITPAPAFRETHTQNGAADDFHLRILRDLKRVHSLIAALAYPILDRAGQLQNRLVEGSAGEPQEPELRSIESLAQK
jgi:phosphate:Na+ symporter